LNVKTNINFRLIVPVFFVLYPINIIYDLYIVCCIRIVVGHFCKPNILYLH